MPIEALDARDEGKEQRVEPTKELVPITLVDDDIEKVTYIRAGLEGELKDELIQFLKNNKDVFAWTTTDMPGIEPKVITHKLNVNPSRKLVKQKKQSFAPEMQEAINAKVAKLLEAKFFEEILYLEWLANPMMVKKENGKWRICIDFTDLNDTCPMDCFPLL